MKIYKNFDNFVKISVSELNAQYHWKKLHCAQWIHSYQFVVLVVVLIVKYLLTLYSKASNRYNFALIFTSYDQIHLQNFVLNVDSAKNYCNLILWTSEIFNAEKMFLNWFYWRREKNVCVEWVLTWLVLLELREWPCSTQLFELFAIACAGKFDCCVCVPPLWICCSVR